MSVGDTDAGKVQPFLAGRPKCFTDAVTLLSP